MASQTVSPQEELFYEAFISLEAEGDTANRTSAFPTQCLVLGDRRVGKTSLVKSLTGKLFDPTQKRTEGIEQSLVDHEWKNCDMKDLIFGDAWRYITVGFVAVVLTRIEGRRREVFIRKEFIMANSLLLYLILFGIFIIFHFLTGTLFKFPVAYLLFYGIDFGYSMIPLCAIHLSNIRFILAPLVFILNHQGLLIGFYLAITACLCDKSYFDFASTREFLTLTIVTGIIFITMLLIISPLRLPFGTDQLVRRRGFIKFLCCCRLPLSIFIGLIYGFTVSILFCGWYRICPQEFKSFINASEITLIEDHNTFDNFSNGFSSADVNRVVASFLATFLMEFPLNVMSMKTVLERFMAAAIRDRSQGPYIALFLVFSYYYCRIMWYELSNPHLTVFFFFPSLFFVFLLFWRW